MTNMMNQAAPPIRMVGEIAQGKTLFNDRKIDNWGDYMLGQVPTASIIARGLGHPLSPQKTSGSDAGTGLVERLGVLGIPIGRMTEQRQQATLNAELDDVEGIFKQVNAAIAPYKITKSTTKTNGTYYIVKDPTGEVISRNRDFNQAVRVAEGSG
jgi:hypothetical protein